MNGAHDLGGMHGFGPVVRDDAVFHAEWEKRVRAMNQVLAAQRLRTLDQSRYAIERMPPADYLRSSYFERWLAGIETTLRDKGLLAPDEVEGRTARFLADPSAEVPRREDPELADRVRSRRTSAMPHPDGPAPVFASGERVVTSNVLPVGHIRLPRYARGNRGVIHRQHIAHLLADAAADGVELLEPLYSVRFEAAELWGASADGRGAVYLDLWESYLTKEAQ